MFVCSFVKCVKTILFNCLVSFNFQCVRLCEWERHKHIKKKLSTWTQTDRVIVRWLWIFLFCFRYVHNWDKIAPWFFFEVWALLISFEVFFFFLNKSVKDKSVWSWKLAWMSALLCPLNFASSFIRNSHHQYVYFFSFSPFHSFKWDTLILFFHFFPPFPSIFHVRVCHNVTARWLPERAHGTQHLCR